jgi:TPP-dependent pyruvate/acetoin dehydrogenase alpha subunit
MTLDTPQLVQMLRTMILIREFDERAIQLRVAGKIYGAVHPYVGQEAVAVGVCSTLTRKDRVTSTHRGHGHCIAKGADIRRMMAELFGRVDGYCKGKGGSMHIADFAVGMLGANGIVGGGLPIACGAALAAQLEGKGDVTVCFFGDGAVAEGEFHEALNIASLWKLPIVFVCENNQYAANNAVAVQHPHVDIVAHAGAYGLPGVIVDGNDVLEVHATTAEAVARARRGDGPSLLECKTYRWRFHAMRATPPPDTRPLEEVASWKARDPIGRFEQHVLELGVLSAAEIAAMRQGVQADLDEAVAFADQSPFPHPKDLLVDMFAE